MSEVTEYDEQRTREAMDEIVPVNAEDDRVWPLLEWSGGTLPADMPRIAHSAEILRREDGMLAEHWDVVQASQGGR